MLMCVDQFRMSTFKIRTPFLPGIAHSQFIRFRVPSAFFVGLAIKPCFKKMIIKVIDNCRKNHHFNFVI